LENTISKKRWKKTQHFRLLTASQLLVLLPGDKFTVEDLYAALLARYEEKFFKYGNPYNMYLLYFVMKVIKLLIII